MPVQLIPQKPFSHHPLLITPSALVAQKAALQNDGIPASIAVFRNGSNTLSMGEEKPMKLKVLQAIVALSLCVSAGAQVNSGSNGSDGAFNPTTNIVINMAAHPNGICHLPPTAPCDMLLP